MSERTVKEQKEAIAYNLQKYLMVPSPYTVWGEDGEMELRANKHINTLRTASEVEAYLIRGSFVRSDYYYLLAAACYQYATLPAINALIRFWKKKDVVEASKEERELLIIPPGDSKSEARIHGLCKKGVITRYDFFMDPSLFKTEERDGASDKVVLNFYRANSHGVGIATTALQKRIISYDLKTAFYSEDEMLRWVQNSVLTASFLQLPYIDDVKFQYVVRSKRQNIRLMSYLRVVNPSKPAYDCDLILESYTLRTNPKVITRKARKESFEKRLAELLAAVKCQEEVTQRAQFLVICVDDFSALKVLLEFLQTNGGSEFDGRILVTTGTVLYARQTSEPGFEKHMKTSFLEYSNGTFTGSTNYYFLMDSIVG